MTLLVRGEGAGELVSGTNGTPTGLREEEGLPLTG